MEQNQDKDTKPICVICNDECKYVGIMECNHNNICYKCIYKMRELSKNKICPLCKTNMDIVIISNNFEKSFKEQNQQQIRPFDPKKVKQNGIYCINPQTIQAMNQIIQPICFAQNCKEQEPQQNLNLLKKHLKEKHMRYLCEICLEYKKCLLSEHQLYSKPELDRHFKIGDIDQDENVYFFHPYCQFCDKFLYDEEKMLFHMTNHFTCHLCPPDKKFYYYNQYDNLEIHFSMSHYLCELDQCRKMFMAFKTEGELEHHRFVSHKQGVDDSKQKQNQFILSNYSAQNILGFKFENEDDKRRYKKKEEQNQILDKEGLDFEEQFLSQRKSKQNYDFLDDHQFDDIFDFREFYIYKYDDENVQQEDLLNLILSSEGYRKRSKQPQNRQNKIQYVAKQNQNKAINLEDIRFLKYNPNQQVLIEEKQLNEYLEQIFDQDQWDQYHNTKSLFFKKQITGKVLFDEFMKLCGDELGYRLFPIYIKTIQNQITAKELDRLYLESIAKLPIKSMNIINTSSKYRDFFKYFLEQLENNIIERMKSNRIKIKSKKFKIDKNRQYQFIGILRRVSVQDMAKLKFISNFGFSIDGIKYVLTKIYFAELNKIQSKIDHIPTEEIQFLYLYIYICNQFMDPVSKQKMLDKLSISSIVYKDIFNKNPQIVEQYCKKHKTHLSDNSSEEEKKKKKRPEAPVNPKFDPKCPFEFPALEQKEEQKHQQQQQQSDSKVDQQQYPKLDSASKNKNSAKKKNKQTQDQDEEDEEKKASDQWDQKNKNQKQNDKSQHNEDYSVRSQQQQKKPQQVKDNKKHQQSDEDDEDEQGYKSNDEDRYKENVVRPQAKKEEKQPEQKQPQKQQQYPELQQPEIQQPEEQLYKLQPKNKDNKKQTKQQLKQQQKQEKKKQESDDDDDDDDDKPIQIKQPPQLDQKAKTNPQNQNQDQKNFKQSQNDQKNKSQQQQEIKNNKAQDYQDQSNKKTQQQQYQQEQKAQKAKKEEIFETFEQQDQAQSQQKDIQISWNNQTTQLYKYENLNQSENLKSQFQEEELFPGLPNDKKKNQGPNLLDELQKKPKKKEAENTANQEFQQVKKKGKYQKVTLEKEEKEKVDDDDNYFTIEQIQYLQYSDDPFKGEGVQISSKIKEECANLNQEGGYPDLSATTPATTGINILEQIQSKPQGKKNRYYKRDQKDEQKQQQPTQSVKQNWNEDIAPKQKQQQQQQQQENQEDEEQVQQTLQKKLQENIDNPKEYPSLGPKQGQPQQQKDDQNQGNSRKIKDQWNKDQDDYDEEDEVQAIGKKKVKGKNVQLIKGGFN